MAIVIDRPKGDNDIIDALLAGFTKNNTVLPANSDYDAETITLLDDNYPLFSENHDASIEADAEQAAGVDLAKLAFTAASDIATSFLKIFKEGTTTGAFANSELVYFRMSRTKPVLPIIQSEADLNRVCGYIATGDAARVLAGGNPMLLPTAAQVAAKFLSFTLKTANKALLIEAADTARGTLDTQRGIVLPLVLDMWDQTEFKGRKLSRPAMRVRSGTWGCIYKTIKEPTAITVQVLDISGGAVIPGATVRIGKSKLAGGKGGVKAQADAHGNVELETDTVGATFINAEMIAYNDNELPITIVSESPGSYIIRLTKTPPPIG